MKKLIAFALAAVMVLGLAACGGSESTPAAPVAGGNTAAPTNGTAASTNGAAAPTETVAAPAETEAAPVETEPVVTEPVETEPVESGADYFTKTGTPAFASASGTVYTNASIGLTCNLAEGYDFASDAAILETNEVATAEELMALDSVWMAQTANGEVGVACYKLGTKEVNSKTTVEDAMLYLMGDDKEYLEIRGATVEEPEEVVATFTAGAAKAWFVHAVMNDVQYVYFYTAYQVGDHMIAIFVQGQSEDGIAQIFEGIDVE